MKVHAYASLPHYAAHLRPVLDAIPDDLRGLLWAPREGLPWGPAVDPAFERGGPEPVLVAGLADMQHWERRRRLIYVEHGAGQTYVGIEDHGSYSGGDHSRFDVALYLAPSEKVADRWRARGADAAAVGCPRLDQHAGRARRPARDADRPVVAFTWHWKCDLVPESYTAWPVYELALPGVVARLRAEGCQVIGHAHPRFAAPMRDWYWAHGIPYLDDLDETLAVADVLVADNTSALPEAAAVGLPLVWLNCDDYRRDVHHGGRFWAWPAGQIQCDHPADLYDAVGAAIIDPVPVAERRRAMVRDVYAAPVGFAALRAAEAVLRVL